jgi:hypothetical protein
MTTADPAETPLAHAVRLLLPFFFQREALPRAVADLGALQHVARKPWPCWSAEETTPTLYLDETLPPVRDFLFGGGAGSCRYLRVPDATADRWFRAGGELVSGAVAAERGARDAPTPLKLRLAAPGVEVFLSPHGVGVFSVTFEPGACGDERALRGFGYRLSQVRPFTAWDFRLPAADQDPTPPPPEAPLTERLGCRGAAFRLIDWAEFLLSPLGALGYRRLQDQFSVYSVTRFGAAADFADPAVTEALRPLLTALAHVEEPDHAGSLTVTGQVLNTRHWAAVGSLGTAHLVADQDPPRPFDAQRLPLVLHKYFIPYLLGLLQRTALQGLLGEARAAFAAGTVEAPSADGDEVAAEMRRLNRQSLALTVNGSFTEVSSREVVNQYYALVQTGLRVADSAGTLQRALHDRFQGDALIGIRDLADRLETLVSEAGRHAGLVAHVQSKLEWLEVFFVSYYFTALMYYVGQHGTLFAHDYIVWSLILAPAVSGGIAFWGLKPHRLHHETATPADDGAAAPKLHGGRVWGLLVGLVGAFALWLVLGFWFFPAYAPAQAPAATAATVAH